jgi:hypothetical protein
MHVHMYTPSSWSFSDRINLPAQSRMCQSQVITYITVCKCAWPSMMQSYIGEDGHDDTVTEKLIILLGNPTFFISSFSSLLRKMISFVPT